MAAPALVTQEEPKMVAAIVNKKERVPSYLILASADYQSAAPSAASGPVMIALRISKTPIVAIRHH